MDLRESLEKLEKSELIDALVELAEKRGDTYAHLAGLVALKKNPVANDKVSLKGMRNDLNAKIESTLKDAEEKCCGKPHLFDDSSRVYDVDATHVHWIKEGRILSPAAKLEALCVLAGELQPNLEGRIYDFEGDRVLLELDNSVVKTIEECDSSVLDVKLLDKVADVFSEDHSCWKTCQEYGLFEDAPSKLKGGSLARKLSKARE